MKQPNLLLADDRDPWDRQPQETAKRYAQFCVFRDLGRTRTVKKAAENLNISVRHAWNLSASGLWLPRAAAWDGHLDHVYAAELAEARREAARQDAKLVAAMKTRVVQALTRITGDDLEPRDIATWARLILTARTGLFGKDVAQAAGGAAVIPDDPDERRLAGYDSEPAQGIAEAKTLELKRLDRLQVFLWPHAAAGDVAAVRAIERLMAARARLLGLTSEEKVEKVTKSELDAELERLLSQMPLELPAQTPPDDAL